MDESATNFQLTVSKVSIMIHEWRTINTFNPTFRVSIYLDIFNNTIQRFVRDPDSGMLLSTLESKQLEILTGKF